MTNQDSWFKAAAEGELNTLQEHLNQTIDINIVDSEQNTALHLATKHAHPHAMHLLIKHGANLDVQNNFLSTPLHLTEKNIDTIRILLEAGANANIQDKDWDYPYYFAFYGSMTRELTELYIKHGAKLMLVDP